METSKKQKGENYLNLLNNEVKTYDKFESETFEW